MDSTDDPIPAAPGAGVAAPPAEPVVSVRDVGKSYRLYARPEDRLKEQLLWRFGRHFGRDFWALRGVSFEVARGERFGIIGRNGSGKSTLLQIIAGTLSPTLGDVRTRGRVAALLELGSGFHPEFTGRDNVLMNAALLGLTEQQAADRFDAIAAFADIGPFIDQPVKTYSTGMLVRLAFSVVTAVDADLLLIDEALAVGDVFFRQKCYGRLDELKDRGVSVVLVSHAMNEIEQFCRRALLLDRGAPLFVGSAVEAVKRYYLVDQDARAASPPPRPVTRPAGTPEAAGPLAPPGSASTPAGRQALGQPAASMPAHQVTNGGARCLGVNLTDAAGRQARLFEQGATALFHVEFELLRPVEVPMAGVELLNERGIVVHGKNTLEHGAAVPTGLPEGTRLVLTQEISLALAVGDYTFTPGLAAIDAETYARRTSLGWHEIEAAMVRLCMVPGAGQFSVTLRREGRPVQLAHHGVADLPGACRLAAVVPGGGNPAQPPGAGV